MKLHARLATFEFVVTVLIDIDSSLSMCRVLLWFRSLVLLTFVELCYRSICIGFLDHKKGKEKFSREVPYNFCILILFVLILFVWNFELAAVLVSKYFRLIYHDFKDELIFLGGWVRAGNFSQAFFCDEINIFYFEIHTMYCHCYAQFAIYTPYIEYANIQLHLLVLGQQ